MNPPRLFRNLIIESLLALSCNRAVAQTEIRGTVYDRSLINEIQGVSVLSTSGAGTITDTLGHYHITLSSTDSIYFTYLGKRTQKFPVKGITDPQEYNISLDAVVTVTLAPILVAPNSYHLDSLENRRENERIFDNDRPSVLGGTNSGAFGVGLDLDMLFNGQAKLNKSRESVQRYFIEDEKQKYVDHRFNKAIVKKITGLEPPALDVFMREYRPSYEFTQSCATDWELYLYIKDWGKSFWIDWKENHKNIPPATNP